MDPKLIEWIAARPRLAIVAMATWRLSWLIAMLGTAGLLGATVALGVFGVGGHDMAGRVSIGALTAFAALMMFAIGSLARLSSGQLKAAVIARRPEAAMPLRRCVSCL